MRTPLIRDAGAHFGSVDILINNAGIQHVAPTEDFPIGQWNAILAINLSAAFHTIRAALPGMQRRKQGRILSIASVHGLVASIHKAAYVAAKHGLIGLTKVVALENAAQTALPATLSARDGFSRRSSRSKSTPGRLSGEYRKKKRRGSCLRRRSRRAALLPSRILPRWRSFCAHRRLRISPGLPCRIDGGWTAQ